MPVLNDKKQGGTLTPRAEKGAGRGRQGARAGDGVRERRAGNTTAAGGELRQRRAAGDYDSGGRGRGRAANARTTTADALGKKVPPPHPLKQPLRVSNKTGGDEKGRSSRAAWAGRGQGLDEAATTPRNETMGAAAATSLLL